MSKKQIVDIESRRIKNTQTTSGSSSAKQDNNVELSPINLPISKKTKAIL